jgi:hypothetical protein
MHMYIYIYVNIYIYIFMFTFIFKQESLVKSFITTDLGMGLDQVTLRVFHIAEIHLVSTGNNSEDPELLFVALQQLLAVTAPLLLYTSTENSSQYESHAYSQSDHAKSDHSSVNSLYPRFVMCYMY